MIQNIRLNTFETNSSTTHAMVICEGDEQYKLWKEGKLYTSWRGDELLTREELYKDFEKELNESGKDIPEEDIQDEFEEWLNDNEYDNYDTWYDEIEHDTNTYTTKSGEKIYIECAFGRDG